MICTQRGPPAASQPSAKGAPSASIKVCYYTNTVLTVQYSTQAQVHVQSRAQAPHAQMIQKRFGYCTDSMAITVSKLINTVMYEILYHVHAQAQYNVCCE